MSNAYESIKLLLIKIDVEIDFFFGAILRHKSIKIRNWLHTLISRSAMIDSE
jgi:hypothetical protein